MPTTSSIWLGRAVFLSLSLMATLIALIPLGLSADAAVMPDLFFCIVFAWTVRRPSTAPFGLIFLVSMFNDVILMKPLGLWTFILVLTMELVRSQRRPIREQPFPIEWIIMGFVSAIAFMFNFLFMKVSFSTGPDLELMFRYFLSTLLFYPIVVAVLHFVFRIRAPGITGELSRFGSAL